MAGKSVPVAPPHACPRRYVGDRVSTCSTRRRSSLPFLISSGLDATPVSDAVHFLPCGSTHWIALCWLIDRYSTAKSCRTWHIRKRLTREPTKEEFCASGHVFLLRSSSL